MTTKITNYITKFLLMLILLQFSLFLKAIQYTGVGKSKFTVVRMEKDIQIQGWAKVGLQLFVWKKDI
jgi:hypothetical protein